MKKIIAAILYVTRLVLSILTSAHLRVLVAAANAAKKEYLDATCRTDAANNAAANAMLAESRARSAARATVVAVNAEGQALRRDFAVVAAA